MQDNPRYPYKPNIPLTVLVNPRITAIEEAQFENYEGCLSVPNLRARVMRKAHIRVQAWDRQGGPLDFVARGITAGTYQHEVDHLDGLLFLDRISDTKSLCTWEHFERYEKGRFVEEVGRIVARWGS
ncbi:MAG: peptide deformylase [Myxococcota bacterium]